jgi:probable rRNA maturation factor
MITFNNQDISFTLKNKTLLKAWIKATIEKKKRKAGDINFIFCSDEHLLGVNQQFLNHNTYTDIITFDYSKEDAKMPISGDIFISVERVEENAKRFGKTKENEMHRVLIHGTLHLLGYKDKTKATKAEMTKQEDLCLKDLKVRLVKDKKKDDL